MREISIQLYSVRERLEADYEGTLTAIANMGFGCVETAGFPGTSPEAAAKLFADLNIKVPSAHSALPVGEAQNEVIETALRFGTNYVITGCPPEFRESMKDRDSVMKTAELYCEAAENAAKHGLSIGYHNHDWDLAEIDGGRAHTLFLDHTPDTVLWEADLFWIAKAGLNPVDFLNEIGSRGKVLHFKDGLVHMNSPEQSVETASGRVVVTEDSPYLPAGTGQVDLRAASDAAIHAEIITVELDSYVGDMMKAVEESYHYLTQKGIASGNR